MSTLVFKKMGSRAFLPLGLLVAIALLISSEVVARDLAQTSTEKQNAKASTGIKGVDDAKYNGNGRYEPACIFPTYPPPPAPFPFPKAPPPCGCGGGPPGGYGGFIPPGGSGPSSPPGGGYGGFPGIG